MKSGHDGRVAIADDTIVVTLRKALASSTEVPPNFMMIGCGDISFLYDLCSEFDLTTETTEENKKASRKGYDWLLRFEKLLRQKTFSEATS